MTNQAEIQTPFKVGDRVNKTRGYLWPGAVVAVFLTTDGKVRVVVECDVPEVRGALHIYAPDQIERNHS